MAIDHETLQSVCVCDIIYPDLSQSRDMRATTTMSEQFGLLYNNPLLKREFVASLGPVRPSLLTCRYVPLLLLLFGTFVILQQSRALHALLKCHVVSHCVLCVGPMSCDEPLSIYDEPL
jgi:hypothetical protein